MTKRSWGDLEIEIIIGTLLRTGVMLAAAVVLLGAVFYLAHHGLDAMGYRKFHGDPEFLRSLTGIVRGAFHLSGRAIIQLGLVILIATPVARVAFSAVAFAIERDYLYVWITLFVLAVLLYSLLGSH
jgi:uncharacterized membrane protein